MDFETQKTTETQKALPSAVSKDVLKKLFAVADIPQFEEYSVFETSDFFKNNYQIDTTMKSHWIDNLDTQKPVKKWGNGGKQIDYL